MKNNAKTCRLNIRLEPDDKEYIQNQCSKNGLDNESECVRSIIRATRENKPIEFESKQNFLLEKELITELNKIGTNINQIAKNNNSHYYSDIDKKKLFAMMGRIESIVSNGLQK